MEGKRERMKKGDNLTTVTTKSRKRIEFHHGHGWEYWRVIDYHQTEQNPPSHGLKHELNCFTNKFLPSLHTKE